MPESRNPTETEDTNQEIFHAARLVFYQVTFLGQVLFGKWFGLMLNMFFGPNLFSLYPYM